MAEWENLEQIEQISSELVNYEQLESQLSSTAQIESELGKILVLSNSNVYVKLIAESEWVEQDGQYIYTLTKGDYKLNNATLLGYLVKNGDVYENAFVGFSLADDGTITLTSDVAVDAKITIQGEV